MVAVGECGLDYFRDFSPRDLQRRAFGWQLELAAATGKPVFLHQRDAHDDFIAILREHRVSERGVAHCFTAGEKERDAYLELGLHIGITGWINDERRGLHLREVVKGIPADRLMIETDAPYLLPRDIRPAPKTRRNEPTYLPYVVRAIAAARGEPVGGGGGRDAPPRRGAFFGSERFRRASRRRGVARASLRHGRARAIPPITRRRQRELALEGAVERGLGVVTDIDRHRCTLRLVERSASAPSSSRQSVRYVIGACPR